MLAALMPLLPPYAPGSSAHNHHVSSSVRQGVRLAVDPGSVRVGIARSDASGLLAFPVVSARRNVDDLDTLKTLVAEFEVSAIYVGLPLSLAGADTASTKDARDYAQMLATELAPVSVWLLDERLTTVTAAGSLRQSGKDARAQRDTIDAAAAAVLLQHALDAEAASGEAVGVIVEVDDGN